MRRIGKQEGRNGYYERDVELAVGLIENLRIPRPRKNTFKSKLTLRCKRRQAMAEKLIVEMFHAGGFRPGGEGRC